MKGTLCKQVRTGHVTLINAVRTGLARARSTSFFLLTRHREQLQRQKLEDEAVPGCHVGQVSTAYCYNFPLPVRYPHCATGVLSLGRVHAQHVRTCVVLVQMRLLWRGTSRQPTTLFVP